MKCLECIIDKFVDNGVDLSGTNSDGDDCEDLTTQPHSTLNSGNMPSSRGRSGVLGDQTEQRKYDENQWMTALCDRR